MKSLFNPEQWIPICQLHGRTRCRALQCLPYVLLVLQCTCTGYQVRPLHTSTDPVYLIDSLHYSYRIFCSIVVCLEHIFGHLPLYTWCVVIVHFSRRSPLYSRYSERMWLHALSWHCRQIMWLQILGWKTQMEHHFPSCSC